MIEQLFNRDFEMMIGTQKIAIQKVNPVTNEATRALRVVFAIEKDDNRDPNRATIEIFNLNKTNRGVLRAGSDLLQSSKDAGLVYDWPLIVQAGYGALKGQIFSGDIVRADSRLNGTDWVTTIEAEDGGTKFRSARISQSFGKGTPVLAVLNALLAELGVGPGNAPAHFAAPTSRGYVVFQNGVALTGKVSKLLDKYITSAGYQWSIQDGQLQVLAPDEVSLGLVTILSPLTGLVGSPEQGEKGIIKARSLLQPSIKPGSLVTMISNNVNGPYKATMCNYFGDSHGQDWYTECEGKPLA